MVAKKNISDMKFGPEDFWAYCSRQNNRDNAPMPTVDTFGKNQTDYYYFSSEPTPYGLYRTARYTPMGYRITYGVNADIWANRFAYRFEEQDQKINRQLNELINKHYTDIHFYLEAQKANGYDREQGGAILVIYREGDGEIADLKAPPIPITTEKEAVSEYDQVVNVSAEFAYDTFASPADLSKPVVRVEAINRMNYYIGQQTSFGEPMYYYIQFRQPNGKIVSYRVHPSRVIRWQTHLLEYEPQIGQSALKPCYGEVQIISNIMRMAGVGAHRWALGIPVIYTKGIKKNAKQIITDNIGVPTSQDFLVLPSEMFGDVKTIGLNGSSLPLDQYVQMITNQCALSTGIPASILMLEKAGVIGTGEVNERTYYAFLDREHSLINPLVEQFNLLDPFMQTIFRSFPNYIVDWGLRQVMTKMEEAQYMATLATIANQMQSFADQNEVRAMFHLPPLEERWKGKEKDIMEMYNLTPTQIGLMIRNIADLRNEFARQVIETPIERSEELTNQSEMLGKNQTQQANNNRGMRNEMKAEHKSWNKTDQDPAQLTEQDILEKFKGIVDQAFKENTRNKIAEESGVEKDAWIKMTNYISKLQANKKGK